MTEATQNKPHGIEKAHCPTCNRAQNCCIHGRTYKPWEWSDNQGNSAGGGVTHSLCECLGCETVFYENSSWDDQDADYWYDRDGNTQSQPIEHKSTYPGPPSRLRPDWFDNVGTIEPFLGRILDETYKAYEQDCYILTAVGLRTALDRCVTAVKIDTAISFEEKLKTLLRDGYIGETEHKLLEVLTDAGNAAAHRAWNPSQDEIKHLLDVLEAFIKRVLINGKRALAISDAIPQRQKRQNSPRKPVNVIVLPTTDVASTLAKPKSLED